jgi:hypothetical protein
MLAVHHREHVSCFRQSILKLCSAPCAGGRLAWQDGSVGITVLTARIPTLAELPLAPGDLTIVLSGPSFAKKLESWLRFTTERGAVGWRITSSLTSTEFKCDT